MKSPRSICLLAAALLVLVTGCGTDQATETPTTSPATTAPATSAPASPTSAATTEASPTTEATTAASPTSEATEPTAPAAARKLSSKELKTLLTKITEDDDDPTIAVGSQAATSLGMFNEVFQLKPKSSCGVLADLLGSAAKTTDLGVAIGDEAMVAIYQGTTEQAKAYLKARDTAIKSCPKGDLVFLEQSAPAMVTSEPVVVPGTSQAVRVTLSGNGDDDQIHMITYRVGGTLVFIQDMDDDVPAATKIATTVAKALQP